VGGYQKVGVSLYLAQAALGQFAGNGLLDTVLRDGAVQEWVLVALGFHLRIGKVKGAVLSKVHVGALLHVHGGGAGTQAAPEG